jgi:hypothetical protein
MWERWDSERREERERWEEERKRWEEERKRWAEERERWGGGVVSLRSHHH